MKIFGDISRLDKPIFGMYVSIADPSLVEMAYNAGFKFIRIDMEHILFDYSAVSELIRTACLLKMPVQVRISDTSDVTKLLDHGVDAIVCPDVETVEQAQTIVDLVKYAPLGKRGMFPVSRFVKFGLDPFQPYTDVANDYVSACVQLESTTALENIDDILSLEGLDIVSSGKADMSQSMGLIGQTKNPRVIEAENFITKKAVEHGKVPIMLAGSRERVHELWELGCRVFTVGPDISIIAKSYKETVESLF